MKERILLMCARVRPWMEITGYPTGSIIDRCARCGADVWLAPSGQAIKAKGASLVCDRCGIPIAKREGALVTQETLDEIERIIPGGAEKAKQILRQFNARHN